MRSSAALVLMASATHIDFLSGTPFVVGLAPGNFTYTFDYGVAQPGKITLNIVPEPGVFALVAFGGWALLRRRATPR